MNWYVVGDRRWFMTGSWRKTDGRERFTCSRRAEIATVFKSYDEALRCAAAWKLNTTSHDAPKIFEVWNENQVLEKVLTQ